MKELEFQEMELRRKITDCINWLLKNHDHPDRLKIMRDKSNHEVDLNMVQRKLQNLREGSPEHGHGDIAEPFKIQDPVKNKMSN